VVLTAGPQGLDSKFKALLTTVPFFAFPIYVHPSQLAVRFASPVAAIFRWVTALTLPLTNVLTYCILTNQVWGALFFRSSVASL